MKERDFLTEKVEAIEVNKKRSAGELLGAMAKTGFQGRMLAQVCDVFEKMITDPKITIMVGYAGSLSVGGQWKIIRWLIEQGLVDILVPTGANISEDIVEAMGNSYYLGKNLANDQSLFEQGLNRYYDIYGKEEDYLAMTELITEFMMTLDESQTYSSREFLFLFGNWLNSKGVDSIVAAAARHNVPVFCPAIADSPYGDAALIAKNRGFTLRIDAIRDYTEFMGLSQYVADSGVFYIGGGVPKDFIQLFAVTADLLFEGRVVPNRGEGLMRVGTDETYHPHKYAIQVTTDSPQWGGLSGATFEEATSWGKESPSGRYAQCFCDATIALPILSHAISERIQVKRKGMELARYFDTK